MAINLTLQITQDDRFSHFGSSPGPFVAIISSVRLVRSYLERAVSEQWLQRTIQLITTPGPNQDLFTLTDGDTYHAFPFFFPSLCCLRNVKKCYFQIQCLCNILSGWFLKVAQMYASLWLDGVAKRSKLIHKCQFMIAFLYTTFQNVIKSDSKDIYNIQKYSGF